MVAVRPVLAMATCDSFGLVALPHCVKESLESDVMEKAWRWPAHVSKPSGPLWSPNTERISAAFFISLCGSCSFSGSYTVLLPWKCPRRMIVSSKSTRCFACQLCLQGAIRNVSRMLVLGELGQDLGHHTYRL